MTTESPLPPIAELPPVSWDVVFEEGEKRIQARFLDAMLLTSSRDRSRLLAQREQLKRKIAHALEENHTRKLERALREQVRLLARLGYAPAEPF